MRGSLHSQQYILISRDLQFCPIFSIYTFAFLKNGQEVPFATIVFSLKSVLICIIENSLAVRNILSFNELVYFNFVECYPSDTLISFLKYSSLHFK